jgi:hypothetical protein
LDGRLLPNSAYTTYFGKPAFHAYGNGNTKPTYGGLNYGQYMKTHNINPHSGDNKPEYQQVYTHAMMEPKKCIAKKGKSKSPQRQEVDSRLIRKPQPPRQAKPKHHGKPHCGENAERNPITD